jgi:hypothetical protein
MIPAYGQAERAGIKWDIVMYGLIIKDSSLLKLSKYICNDIIFK